MVHFDAPYDPAEPALDIRLSQNPNAYFFPASTISGHVIYRNSHGNADYDLRLIFGGYNSVSIGENDPVRATLFEYSFNLHTARKGESHRFANKAIDLAPQTFPFRHRFPANTDNRSFNLPGGSACDGTFSNYAHELPPSFGSRGDGFQCSVEYCLRAELIHEGCVVQTHTLPVMFLPYMRPRHSKRSKSGFPSLHDPWSDISLSKARKDSFVNHYPDITSGTHRAETSLDMSIKLPSEITSGVPFPLTILLQLPYSPKYDTDIPDVSILGLRMTATATCRTVAAPPLPSYSPTSTTPLPDDSACLSRTKHLLLHPVRARGVPPTFDSTTDLLAYSFHATLSTYYAPSFSSFLVANDLAFDSPVLLALDGRRSHLKIPRAEVAVLSPVMQSGGAGARRSGLGTARLSARVGAIT